MHPEFQKSILFLQYCPETFQISPSTLAQNWIKPLLSIQHSPLWLNKYSTWNSLGKKRKKKKEQILKKKRFYHLQTVYFNCTCTASQLSFFSSIGHLYPPPSPPLFFSLEVLLKFSMSSDFFLRKKMVNGLTYNTCTTYNIFTVTIQFPLVKQF